MPRKNINYRDNLERLIEHFGKKEILSIQDVINYTGKSRNFVTKNLMLGRYITVCNLAKVFCDYVAR